MGFFHLAAFSVVAAFEEMLKWMKFLEKLKSFCLSVIYGIVYRLPYNIS